MQATRHPHTHPFKRERIAVAIGLSFALIIPELGYALDWLLFPTILTGLATLGVLAAIERDRADLVIVGVSAAVYVMAWLLFPEIPFVVKAIRATSTLAFGWLTITFLIGPWSHLTKRVQPLYHERRHLGVSAFLFGLLHAHLVYKYYFVYDLRLLVTHPGFFGLVYMGLLAATSTQFAQRKISEQAWNWIYNVAFAFFILDLLVISLLWSPFPEFYMIAGGLFLVLFAAFAPYGLPKKILRSVSGWKQTHMLMWVIYIGLSIHAGGELLVYQETIPTWAGALLAVAVGSVFLTHATGWVVMLVQRIRQGRLGHDQIILDGVPYYAVSPAKDFEDGKGKKFILGGNPVAIFKVGDEFKAFSSICPHQAGPMEDGEIIGNVVQCPLHDWQFNVDDGSPGPNALECLPYYNTVVQNNLVFVAAQSTGRCNEVNGHFFFSPQSQR